MAVAIADEIERYMLELVNAERAAFNLPPLRLEQHLNASAEAHSEWTLENNTFSHTGEAGSSSNDRMRQAGFDFSGTWYSGENLAVQSIRGEAGYFDDARNLHEALMNSPGHRANILNPNYEMIGIGIEIAEFTYSGGQRMFSVVATQNFAATEGTFLLDPSETALPDPNEEAQGVPSFETLIDEAAIERVSMTVEEVSGGRVSNIQLGDSVEILSALSGVNEPLSITRDRETGMTSIDIGDDDSVDLQFIAEGDFDFFTVEIVPGPDGAHIVLTATYDPATVYLGTAGSDNFLGTVADERFFGAEADDTLNGFDGDDTIKGGGGADLMIGGKGSDVIYVDDPGDRVSESRNWAGSDTVIASIDFRMKGVHIEDLELTGTAKIGVGNGLMNTITGNDADNILDGGSNNDTLIGGLGDDRYFVRAPGDTVIEEAGAGVDVVLAFRSYALEAHVEKLYMQTVYTRAGDPASLNGIGNDLDNTIVGTPFSNFIIGREGRDTLKGQAGADSFVFDRAIGPSNVDRIVDFNTNEANEGDRLLMKGAVFGDLAAGVLDVADFVAGTAALDASDRFIFDQNSGRLWFDADGSGDVAPQLVATFDQNAIVTAMDIEIF